MASPQPQAEEVLLECGHVLVFVDDKVAVLGAYLLGDGGVLLQDAGHDEQNVFEVDDTAFFFGFFVGVHQALDIVKVEVAR